MTESRKIRILVVDDHHLVRAGIVALLSDQEDMEVIAEASNGSDAIREAGARSPDVILMDLSMPSMDGIKAAEEILRVLPETKILMLTQYDQQEYVKRVMHSGVRGYILKSSLLEDLTTAIRTVNKGKRFITPKVSDVLADEYFSDASKLHPRSGSKRLTNREQEILHLVAGGCSNQEISARLFISVRTVEFHRKNIMGKLDIHDIPRLVKYAIQNKIIDLDV